MKLHTPAGTQDFMWFVLNEDGSHVTEIEHGTWERADYSSINFDSVVEYGILGIGEKLYVTMSDGVFHVLGHTIRFSYTEDGKELLLTGREQELTPTKPYKQAQAVTMLSTGTKNEGRAYFEEVTNILSYEFGVSGETEGLQYVIRLFMVRGERMYLNIQATSDKKRNGELVIRLNTQVAATYDAPLIAGETCELNWTFKQG